MKISTVIRIPIVLALLLAGCRERSAPERQPPNTAPANASAQATRGAGVLVGVVRLERPAGKPPSSPAPESVRRVCGDEIVSGDAASVETDGQGGLANAVVFLESPPLPGPERVVPTATLDQRRCRYEPAVIAATVGAHLRLKNSDPLMHNVHAVRGTLPVFNFAMPLENMEVMRTLPMKSGEVLITCDVHPWMRASVMTFDHPFFTVTDDHGRFTLEGLPQGPQTLRVFHPRAGEQRLAVNIPATGAAPEVSVVLPGSR